MCELLILARDDGEVAHPMRYRPGDVVTVQEDGWRWGGEELAGPCFRILALPGFPAASAEPLLGHLLPERDHNLAPTTYERRRAFGLGPAHAAWPAGFRGWWGDASRAQPIFTAAALDLGAVTTARPALPLPHRI